MSKPETVVVTGATGLVGRRLVAALQRDEISVHAFSRSARDDSGDRVTWESWNGAEIPAPALSGAKAVVHLAGEPVFAGRLTATRRARILDSRVQSTRSIVSSLEALPEGERPEALVCASAVGYYGSRGDEVLDEASPPGEGFLAEVCIEWERAAREARALGVRVVSLRIGVVLSREGGALPRLSLPFRIGLGGRLGNGQQWFPWIHLDDLVALTVAALRGPRFQGAVNGVAPECVRNVDLTRALGRVLGRPTPFPVPALVLRAALGELSGELLGSRRVVPREAQAHGFHFAHETLESALTAELA